MRKISRISLFAVVASVLFVTGCSMDKFSAPSVLPRDQLPFTLEVRQRVIEMSTVAPYDTLTVDAQLLTVDGEPIEDAFIEFASSDSALRVSSSGKLTARLAKNNVKLTIAGKAKGAALTAIVDVKITNNANPERLRNIMIGRAGGDSNFFAATEQQSETRLQFEAYNTQGNSITGVTPYWWVSPNTTVAAMRGGSNSTINYLGPGEVMVYITTTYYGITAVDSIRFVMLPPKYARVLSRDRINLIDGQRTFYFSPDTVIISAGGIVNFENSVPGTAMDIQFSDPGAASPGCLFGVFCGGEIPTTGGTGNIAPFEIDNSVVFGNTRTRRFSIPGTYQFWSSRSSDTGVVVVK